MSMLLAALLLAVAIAATVIAVVQGGDTVALEVFGRDLDPAVWAVFVAGVIAGLIALLGVVAMAVGIRRRRARHREVRQLREKVAEQDRADSDVTGTRTADERPEHPRGRRHADMP